MFSSAHRVRLQRPRHNIFTNLALSLLLAYWGNAPVYSYDRSAGGSIIVHTSVCVSPLCWAHIIRLTESAMSWLKHRMFLPLSCSSQILLFQSVSSVRGPVAAHCPASSSTIISCHCWRFLISEPRLGSTMEIRGDLSGRPLH